MNVVGPAKSVIKLTKKITLLIAIVIMKESFLTSSYFWKTYLHVT